MILAGLPCQVVLGQAALATQPLGNRRLSAARPPENATTGGEVERCRLDEDLVVTLGGPAGIGPGFLSGPHVPVSCASAAPRPNTIERHQPPDIATTSDAGLAPSLAACLDVLPPVSGVGFTAYAGQIRRSVVLVCASIEPAR